MLKTADVLSGGRIDFGETQTVARHIIVSGGVLLGIGDKERAADVLDVERSKTTRNFLGIEGIFAKVHTFKIRVVDLDFCGTEIRYIEKFVAIDFAGGCAFVDGTIRGTVIGIVDNQDGILSAVPAGDGSIFCGKDEAGGFAGSNQKIRGAAIENDACGSRCLPAGEPFGGGTVTVPVPLIG